MKKRTNNILTLLIAIASLVSVALLWKHNWILFLILVVLAAFMLLMNKSKQEIKTFIFCGFFGAIAENMSIILGGWSYGNPNLHNIPIWLIVLWGIASIFMVRAYSFFKK